MVAVMTSPVSPTYTPEFLGPGLTGDVSATLLDSTLTPIAPLDLTSMSASLFFNQVGTWACAVQFNQTLWNAVKLLLAGNGMVIDFNWGSFKFGGRVEIPGFQDSVPGAQNSAVTTVGPNIVFSGATYLSLLANRIAYPAPGSAWSANTIGGADAQSAVAAETAIKHYVTGNTGVGAAAGRQISFLTVATNLARGGTVSYSASIKRGTDLAIMDVIRNIVRKGGPMGVDITLDRPSKTLIFDCYVPNDLTKKAYFSMRLGNLTSVGLQIEDPTVTNALVVGTSALIEVTASGSANPWTHIEQIVDQSGSTDTTNNTQAGNDAVTQGIRTPGLAISATDIPKLQFGRDYFLGDKVTVEIAPGDSYPDVISQVDLSFDGSQNPPVVITPVIGVSTDSGNMTTSLQRQLVRRVRQLERRLNAIY
jgi:hypothetical protein